MAIDVHELCNGKIVQTWHVEDWLSGMFEMGALPFKMVTVHQKRYFKLSKEVESHFIGIRN